MIKSRTVEDIQKNLRNLTSYDYVVIFLMLVVCLGIGLYYGFKRKKRESDTAEYLMGSRNIAFFPISMSLLASFLSGITILGFSTETYLFGIGVFWSPFGILIAAIIFSYIHLPVIYNLRVASVFEYLERRFDTRMRVLGAFLFAINSILKLPIVIYMPAVALNQLTGVNVHVITTTVSLICIIYTAVGGLRAVVWTDVVQSLVMAVSVLFVAIEGTSRVGGFDFIWQKGIESGRIALPPLEFDLTEVYGLWSILIGNSFAFPQVLAEQHFVQRYLILPTLKQARWSLIVMVAGICAFVWLGCYSGLLAYAMYYDCDPFTTNLVPIKDQLLSVLVGTLISDYKAMSGLFIAGVLSAGLSTMSTSLNSMSVTVLEDFVKPFRKTNMSPRATFLTVRLTTVVFGVLCIALVFVYERLGTLTQLFGIVSFIAYGPLSGIFLGGLLIPWINSSGTFYGVILGIITSAVLNLGHLQAKSSGKLQQPKKITSVANCDYSFNASIILPENPEKMDGYVFPLFKLSYLMYGPLSTLITLIFAVIISYFTGFSDLSKVDPQCFCHFIRKYLPRRKIESGSNSTEMKVLLERKNDNLHSENDP